MKAIWIFYCVLFWGPQVGGYLGYGQSRFAYSRPDLWWNLLTVRDPSLSLTQFCVQLETVVYSRAQ